MPIIEIEKEARVTRRWRCGDHSGTVTLPSDERGPIEFEWDNSPPEDWEDIEQAVTASVWY